MSPKSVSVQENKKKDFPSFWTRWNHFASNAFKHVTSVGVWKTSFTFILTQRKEKIENLSHEALDFFLLLFKKKNVPDASIFLDWKIIFNIYFVTARVPENLFPVALWLFFIFNFKLKGVFSFVSLIVFFAFLLYLSFVSFFKTKKTNKRCQVLTV